MGTPSVFGFKCGGEYKAKWYRWDGYPSGTGKDVADFVSLIAKAGELQQLERSCKNVKLIEGEGYIGRDVRDPVLPFMNDIYRGKTEMMSSCWEDDWGNVTFGYIVDLDDRKFKVFAPKGVPGTEEPRSESFPEYQPYGEYEPAQIFEIDIQHLVNIGDEWMDEFYRETD
jgi:hypothetical protein